MLLISTLGVGLFVAIPFNFKILYLRIIIISTENGECGEQTTANQK
jgi:hypothetical protein